MPAPPPAAVAINRAEEEEQGLTHVDETKYTVESAGPQIEEFLDTVFDHLDFDVEYEILEGQHLHPDLEDPDLLVKFTGPDVDLLLANKAELMLAVEFLTMEVLRMPPEHHSRLVLDANDYRMLRIEELRLSAVTAAEKVKQTRRPFHFNPMNSRERRIIHLSLRNETEIRSESTGTGPLRQVVVLPIGHADSGADSSAVASTAVDAMVLQAEGRAGVPVVSHRRGGDRDRGDPPASAG